MKTKQSLPPRSRHRTQIGARLLCHCVLAVMLFSAGSRPLAQENSPADKLAGDKKEMPKEADRIGLVIHGGAGTIDRAKMTKELESEYRSGLERALVAGFDILQRGGSSLDATEAAVRV